MTTAKEGPLLGLDSFVVLMRILSLTREENMACQVMANLSRHDIRLPEFGKEKWFTLRMLPTNLRTSVFILYGFYKASTQNPEGK